MKARKVMKISLKSAMFSCVVFPGAGYFLVNKKIMGWVSLAITIACLAVIMVDVHYRADIIAQKIIYGAIPFDFFIIREQILITPGRLGEDLLNNLSITIGIVWFVGVIDCYFTGRRLERDNQQH